jgi:hypothetical protein
MEGLIELVAASFARHGIECPANDSQFVWGRPPSPAPAERAETRIKPGVGLTEGSNPAAACDHSDTALAEGHTPAPAEPTALPEHNYRKSLQGDPAP